MSQYFLGALNGACGFQNPTARKNGLSFTSPSTRTASAATWPSKYASSGTSRHSQRPFAFHLRVVVAVICVVEKFRCAPRTRIAVNFRMPVVENFPDAARVVAVL